MIIAVHGEIGFTAFLLIGIFRRIRIFDRCIICRIVGVWRFRFPGEKLPVSGGVTPSKKRNP